MTSLPTLARPAASTFALLALLVGGSPARAGIITFDATPYTGDPARAIVTFDDVSTPGSVWVGITVDTSLTLADINGFFFNVADESLLPGLSITGDVTMVVKQANSVMSAGPGNNIRGEGVGPFDVGVRIGTPGIGEDDICSTALLISHSSASLTNDMFVGATTEGGDIFAVRLTSVGPEGSRNGSSKLCNDGEPPTSVSIPHVPEPSTLAGFGTLCGLSLLARGLRRNRDAANS
jgi:hypothetical protein